MLQQIREQAEAIGRELPWELTPELADERFFQPLRESRIPYLCAQEVDRPAVLHKLSFDALYLLARASLPCTVALTMHQYVSASLAAVSPLLDSARRLKIERLVNGLEQRKQLLGIAEFGDHLQPKGTPEHRLKIEDGEQGYQVSGRRNLVSLTEQADRLTLVGHYQDRLSLFVIDFKDRPGVQPQASVMHEAARLTQTRPVVLEQAGFEPEDMICDDPKLTLFLCTYTTAWFQALIAATYLGAASRALEEVRAFARQVHVPEGGPLAELDGFVVDFGRLALQLKGALALASSFGPALMRVHRLAKSAGDRALSDGMDELVELSSLIKHQSTSAAQEIVLACRRMIGTRSLVAGHPLVELTHLISIGPLHPVIGARFERSLGRQHLGPDIFKGLFVHL